MAMFCPDLMQTIFSFLPLSQVYKSATVNKEWHANVVAFLSRIPRLGMVRPHYLQKVEMLTGRRRDLFTTLPLDASFTFTVGSKDFHLPQSVSLLPSFTAPQEIKSMLGLVDWKARFVKFSEKGWRAVQRGEKVTINNIGWPGQIILSGGIPKDMDKYISQKIICEVYAEDEVPDFLKGRKVEASPGRKLTIEERREELRKMRDENTIFIEGDVERLGFRCVCYRHRSYDWYVFYGVCSEIF